MYIKRSLDEFQNIHMLLLYGRPLLSVKGKYGMNLYNNIIYAVI